MHSEDLRRHADRGHGGRALILAAAVGALGSGLVTTTVRDVHAAALSEAPAPASAGEAADRTSGRPGDDRVPDGTGGSGQANEGALAGAHQRLAGLTGGEVLGEGWYTVLTLPKNINPVFGKGERCVRLGLDDKLLIVLNPGPTCTVEAGTAVFVFGYTSFCDTAEPPPFFAVSEQDQRACAWESLASVTDISVSVDGGEAVDIQKERYATCSQQRQAELRADNFLGVPAQYMTFTACGWIAWVTDLQPGDHVIRSIATFSDGSEHVYSPVIKVVGAPAN